MSDPLLILGASTRAAAGSAIRAGLSPIAADLFCDDDLRQMTEQARRVTNYPLDLPALASECPPCAWMYTGALENHPRIIDAISAERILWGTPADSTRRVRDPWQLSQCLDESGLHFPKVVRADQRNLVESHAKSQWVKKPYRSAGGGGIQPWPASGVASAGTTHIVASPNDDQDHYLQNVVDGQSQSALFVAARGAAVLLGVTEQLIGARWTGATGFRYAGSIGPLRPSASHLSQWRRIGDCLARGFDLQGLFGVDAIVNDRGIWTIEVNPRYTSSVEVLEFGLELRAVADHVVACRDGRLNDGSPAPCERFRGKAVIYASGDVRIGDPFVNAARLANAGQPWPSIADIPTAGQIIEKGRPVATVFTSSDRLDDVEPQLQDEVRAWRTKWNL